MTSKFFLKEINCLTAEEFDELILVFISERFGYEPVNVNGPNDGGNDIKIYQNKKEIKRCIQVSVRKDFETKVKEDLKKVKDLITKYQYSSFFEFYCTSSISEEKVNELKQYADDEYSIALDIYDANRLAQLGGKKFRECILKKYPDLRYKTSARKHSKQEKVLFDVLATGNDTSDIKNGILYSFIVFEINKYDTISFKDLKVEIEKVLPNVRPNELPRAISYLIKENRIVKNEDGKYQLTEQEKKCIEDIFIQASTDENDFNEAIEAILKKHNIPDCSNKVKPIIEKLCAIYKKDIDDKSFDTREANERFNAYIVSLSNGNANEIKTEIEQLCAENTYIQRLTYSESFFSLYKSNELEDYINEKDNVIFLDTPAFVYYLCSGCSYTGKYQDWENPLYKSICSLLDIYDNQENFQLNIMSDYINEAAGELKKAIQLSWIIDKYPALARTTKTNNSFLEFYRWSKEHGLFEDEVETFSDFVQSFLGINTDEMDYNSFFSMVYHSFVEIAKNGGFEVVFNSNIRDFEEHVKEYAKLLINEKSKSAISNDVNQVVYMLNRSMSGYESYNTNLYLVTWDKTLYKLRDKLIEKFHTKYPYEYFYIVQPSKLVNKLSLANFKINNIRLDSSVLAYADKYFGTSSKIKGLLDYIAPLFNSNSEVEKSNYFLTKISKIEEKQLHNLPEIETPKSKDSTQVYADALEFMLPITEDEKIVDNLYVKFKQVIFSKEWTDKFMECVSQLVSSEKVLWQQQKNEFYIHIELPDIN